MQVMHSWRADEYDEKARFVSEEAGEILRWLDARPGERILDLGCGSGVIARDLMRRGCSVLGLDIDPDMLRAARARGVSVVQGSGEQLPFEQEFDAVFSNAALHWMSANPAVVAEGVARALKPGGRFVAEFGGHGNMAAVITALRAVARRRGSHEAEEVLASSWYFPSPEDYRTLLERNGLAVERIELVPRPTVLPGSLGDWLNMFCSSFLAQFGEDAGVVVAEVEDLLRPVLCDSYGRWTADYVRLRVLARKPR